MSAVWLWALMLANVWLDIVFAPRLPSICRTATPPRCAQPSGA